VNDFSGTVLLASRGEPLFVKGVGYANIEWQIPNTAKTKFRIGSMTKQFTSMLVMQLREQGKIKLEDSVCVYVTPCPDAWKPVTIHHLLTHTSGIPAYTGIASWRETNMVPKTIDQMVALFRDLPLQWVPGEKYAYNNSGYFLLGVVIEKASGKKYEQALQEMILTPLGLTDTGYDWSKTIIARRASGYTGRGTSLENAPALDMQQPYAAGSMYSTVDDLLKWDQALYTEKLLPAAAKQVMWTPAKENYAYGWTVSEPAPAIFGGHRRLAHTGGINGFSSVIVRLPEPNVTFIVLSNTTRPAPPASRATSPRSTTDSRTRCRSAHGRQNRSGGARRLRRAVRAGARLRHCRDPRRQQPDDAGHGPGKIRNLPRIRDDVLRESDTAHHHVRQGRGRKGDPLPAEPGRPGPDGEADSII
jgi:CubicO group peptidase (beta-lactamase class C family)